MEVRASNVLFVKSLESKRVAWLASVQFLVEIATNWPALLKFKIKLKLKSFNLTAVLSKEYIDLARAKSEAPVNKFIV